MSSGLSPKKLTAGLYLVATPIGNLGDMTARGIDILGAADMILCEDTRVTGKLLSHFGLSGRLQVYNNQSEPQDHTALIDKIQQGQIIALVSDAGMPLMSDPGYQLVQSCLAAGVYVTSAPGANAILTGLQLSGLGTDRFLFLGFLPHKKQERRVTLQSVAGVPATLIFFERADRTVEALRDVLDVMGPRRVAVAREMTKLFEEVRRGMIDEVIGSLEESSIKGEVVILVDRPDPQASKISPADLDTLLRHHLAQKPLRVAAADVAGLTGLARREVYNRALELREEGN